MVTDPISPMNAYYYLLMYMHRQYRVCDHTLFPCFFDMQCQAPFYLKVFIIIGTSGPLWVTKNWHGSWLATFYHLRVQPSGSCLPSKTLYMRSRVPAFQVQGAVTAILWRYGWMWKTLVYILHILKVNWLPVISLADFCAQARIDPPKVDSHSLEEDSLLV